MTKNKTKEKILMSWSGGKDSAMALYEIQRSGEYEVMALVTTVTEEYNRISMHGVRRTLLERQATLLDLPVEIVSISPDTNNAEYETKMEKLLRKYQAKGVKHVAFGDIFLEDLKKYREKNLGQIGMTGLFPIWKRKTSELVREFIQLGFRAVLTCIDPKKLDPSFAGRIIDSDFLKDLPADVDPCGENGEFHSFVSKAPIFREEIKIKIGEKVFRDSFWFCDVLPR